VLEIGQEGPPLQQSQHPNFENRVGTWCDGTYVCMQMLTTAFNGKPLLKLYTHVCESVSMLWLTFIL